VNQVVIGVLHRYFPGLAVVFYHKTLLADFWTQLDTGLINTCLKTFV